MSLAAGVSHPEATPFLSLIFFLPPQATNKYSTPYQENKSTGLTRCDKTFYYHTLLYTVVMFIRYHPLPGPLSMFRKDVTRMYGCHGNQHITF